MLRLLVFLLPCKMRLVFQRAVYETNQFQRTAETLGFVVLNPSYSSLPTGILQLQDVDNKALPHTEPPFFVLKL